MIKATFHFFSFTQKWFPSGGEKAVLFRLIFRDFRKNCTAVAAYIASAARQATLGTDVSCQIRNFQLWSDPVEIGILREESVKLVDLRFFVTPVRRDQQFCQRNCGRDGCVISLFQPVEYLIGQANVTGICFQLINENVRV